MAGPSQQLCAFLIKVVDFFEDEDQERRKQEMVALSFHIVEAIAIFVQQQIDVRAQRAESTGNPMPEQVRKCSDEILVIVGKSRGLANKIEAKNNVLKTVGGALDKLGSFMKATYPTIFDSNGDQLNNFEASGQAQPLNEQL